MTTDNPYSTDIGPHLRQDGAWEFTVWAPFAENAELHIADPVKKNIPLKKDGFGYWRATAKSAREDFSYFIRLNDAVDRPDPASHFQPGGVHGPSRTVRHDLFEWRDNTWKGMPLEQMIMYELHTGTITKQGTFEAAIDRIAYLKELGVTAIDIMPVAQFPGSRNWGYDGVHPFAVQNSYGGPGGLKRFVDEAHRNGLAVILDVVYNHLGPEGNYLHEFGPYFTDKYKTPWGRAINFDDAGSDGVRNFFIRNALFWYEQYHIDALRLDAIHGIFDFSARPFLAELADDVKKLSRELGRPLYLIAESNLNDTRVIRSREENGLGMDAQWSDDFHHALHSVLTGERDGYYEDYGSVSDLRKALSDGFVYDWKHSPFRDKRYGSSSARFPASQLVISTQTHDQVGNRLLGERLSSLVSFDALKVAAAAMILSPYLPMLFMGEEYGETAPFLYFISHTDENLVQAVRDGRKEEFASFGWKADPPDPQDLETFEQSRLDWSLLDNDRHRALFDFYRELIRLRKSHPALLNRDREDITVTGGEESKTIVMIRGKTAKLLAVLFNFGEAAETISIPNIVRPSSLLLDSSEKRWAGSSEKRSVQLDGHFESISLPPLTVVILEKGDTL
jgi:maltooligosyltrehalose trehalohydrolase